MSDLNINVKKLRPFTKFMSSIGALPTSYLISMTYQEQLTWFCNYLEKTVIPAINNNGLAIEELQAKYIELKDYVDHYFDNLDVQQEIDNKLDDMAESGQLAEIINQEIFNDLNSQVEQNTQDISTINDSIQTMNTTLTSTTNKVNILDNNVDLIIDKLREDNYNYYKILNLETTSPFFNKIKVYESMDKQNYKYDINEDNLKNSGGSNIYVDKSFTGSSTGTNEAPYKNLQTAVANSSNGDTIIVRKGIYRREELPGETQIYPNINIICDDEVFFTASSELTWTQNETYSNVYQATRSNSTSVIDIRNPKIPVKLIKKDTLLECSNTKGSYYTDNTIVYVNLDDTVTNDKIVVNLAISISQLNFAPKNNANLKIYLENAICLNGNQAIVKASNSASYSCEFNAKNCKFLYTNSSSSNGIDVLGANGVFINCEASYNDKDGFNYHANNGATCKIIEINCIGSCNGIGKSDHTYNGSSIHDGGEIIRINGNYFKNNGGNVTDVSNNTISVNICCNAFDSTAGVESGYNSDFCTQQAGTTMYLYNCIAKGTSYKNLFAVTDSTIYASNCKYDTTDGNVIIS